MAMLHRDGDLQPWAREIEKSAQILDRIERRDARAHAALLRAALATRANGPDERASRRAIADAATLYRGVGMEALAIACEGFADPGQRQYTRSELERSGIADPELWIRGFVPLGP